MKKIDLKEATRKLFEFRPDEAYSEDEVYRLWCQWKTKAFQCQKGEVCFKSGGPATKFAVVVRGLLHVRMPCPIGEDVLIRAVRPGEYVGLPLLYAREKAYPFDVVAAAPETEIAVFKVDVVRRWRTDPKARPLFDFIGSLMGKNIRDLQLKAMILDGRDIIERLRRYLSVRMEAEGSRTIAIPGTSADLADYLSVNRFALSRAIHRLKDEGKIEFKRNVFTVL